MIHDMGGLTYVAHPFDRRRAHFSLERLAELAPRLDIIETYNPWCPPAANQAAAAACRELEKVPATGSDAHAPGEVGLSWMEIEPYHGVADFLTKLKSARHVITNGSGSRHRA